MCLVLPFRDSIPNFNHIGWKMLNCETFLYLSPLYQFRIGEDPSSSTPVLRGRRGAFEREARWRPRDPSQSRKRESPFRASNPRWRPVDFRWRKRARARASKNFHDGYLAFYWHYYLVSYIKLNPRLRSFYWCKKCIKKEKFQISIFSCFAYFWCFLYLKVWFKLPRGPVLVNWQ